MHLDSMGALGITPPNDPLETNRPSILESHIMSNISNRHNINRFVSGKSEPLAGQRLAKVGYKSTDKTPAKFPSVCASVPPLGDRDILPHIDALLPHIRTFLEGVQDRVVRSLYESSGGLLSSVSDSEISVSACIAYLASEGAGGKLSAELISFWFEEQMKDNLTVVFADKLGFPELTAENMVTISQHLNAYKALFCALPGTKNAPTRVQCENLRKVMNVCGADTDVGVKVSARISELLKETSKPVFELLDF